MKGERGRNARLGVYKMQRERERERERQREREGERGGRGDSLRDRARERERSISKYQVLIRATESKQEHF